VFFRSAGMRDAARDTLAASFGSRLASLGVAEVDDEDWARRSQAVLTSVRVGRIVNGRVEILAGLAAGERVALDPIAASKELKPAALASSASQ